MEGYFVSNEIQNLVKKFDEFDQFKNLNNFYVKCSWSAQERQHLMDLISECLTISESTIEVAHCFSPLLLDLLYRTCENQSKVMVFCTLAKLIGFYASAKIFLHNCFSSNMFSNVQFQIQNEIDEKLLIDFLESCYILLNFNLSFFTNHLDLSFLKDFFQHSNQYCRFMSIMIYSKVLMLDSNSLKELEKKFLTENSTEFQIKLYQLSNFQMLKRTSSVIEYKEASDSNFGMVFISDLSPKVICIDGILLSKYNSFDTQNYEKLNFVMFPSIKKQFEQIALNVSLGNPILIEGSVGVGKSAIIYHLAQVTGRNSSFDVISIQISDQIDTKYLIGSYVCSNVPGEFVFNPGPLLLAIRNGNWIIFEDIDHASSDFISLLISLVEFRNTQDFIYLNKKEKFNINFQVFLTKNSQTQNSSVNLDLLERICCKVSLQNPDPSEVAQVISLKWPNLNLINSRIVSIYENLIYSYPSCKYKSNKTNRLSTFRDFIKWCNRLSSYFKVNSDETAKNAFLDAIDCFFSSSQFDEENFVEKLNFLGSNFNISKLECHYLIEKRIPQISITESHVTVGRQTISRNSFSKCQQNFAFTQSSLNLLEKLFVCVNNNEPVLLSGETGVGKTSCIQYLADLHGKKLNVINMNQQNTGTELFGSYKPVDFSYLISFVKDDYNKLFDKTFDCEKNSKFLNKFSQLFLKQDWNILLKIMEHTSQKALNKIQDENLVKEWSELNTKVFKLQKIVQNSLLFAFIEGVLTNAAKLGEWVLLDEINLAEKETLQNLFLLLDNHRKSFILFEKSEDQQVRIHEDFRIFACMNPATDIGKRQLLPQIQNRFTEFFIKEITDKTMLRIIVHTYIGNLIDAQLIESIVDFYIEIKNCSQTILKDINDCSTVFSLRNLCRALRVAKANIFNSVKRSVYEAFLLAFLSNLNQKSYESVKEKIEKMLFANAEQVSILLSDKKFEKNFSEERFAIIENYPIPKGKNSSFIDSSYILTETVRKNLRDICRVISVGQNFPILLQGETSVGKTSLIQWLAKATGNICHRVNNHEHTDLQEYIGGYHSDSNGKFFFKNGVLVEAMRNGHWIILDELNLAPTEILEALNRVLDDNREIFIAETQEVVKADPQFIFFATQNPPGKYGGRKVLSRAFRNRFIELNFGEIPKEELEIILHKKCLLPSSYSKRMVSVLIELQKCRNKYNIFAGKHGFITLRDLFRWGHRFKNFSENMSDSIVFFDWNKFLAEQGFMLLAGRVRKHDEIDLIKNILEKQFRCKISLQELFFQNDSSKFSNESYKNIVWTNAFNRLGTLINEAIKYREPILLVGPTGCGKTSIIQNFSKLYKKDLKIVNCHLSTEASDFLGSLKPNRNSNEPLFEWVDGSLITAMKEGHFLLIDEISLADDSVLERLNSVLELERTIFLAENLELIRAHPSFSFLATMNPGGDFGKKELSPALRDRFTEIWCPAYDDIDDIRKIIFHCLKINNIEVKTQLCDKICFFVSWFYENFFNSISYSVRDIISWADFINKTFIEKNYLSLCEAFMNGANLVFIDALGTSCQTFTRQMQDLSSLKSQCESFAQKLSQDLSSTRQNLKDSFDTNSYFSVPPFHIEKGHHLNNQKTTSGYFWNSPGTKSNLIRLMRALQLDKPILLEGLPGVGKTSLIQALASASNHTLVRINLSDQTDIADLFGCDLPKGDAKKFEFCEGPFLKALKSDSTWILLDELNLAPQTVLEGLNACFDHRGEIFVPELNRTFYLNKSLNRIFATQNPYSMDSSRKGLARSFLNRFTIVYVEELIDEDFNFVLSHLYPDIESKFLNKMILLNKKICSLFKQKNFFTTKNDLLEFNLRDLIRWCDLIQKHYIITNFIQPELYFDLIYSNKMRTLEDCEKMKAICFEEFSWKRAENDSFFFINELIFQCGYSLLKINNNFINDDSTDYLFTKQAALIESIMKCIEMNWMTILVGASGTCKSHLVKMISRICGQKLNIFYVNSEMDTTDLLGGFEQKDYLSDLNDLEEEVLKQSFISLKKNNLFFDLKLFSKFYTCFHEIKNFKSQEVQKIFNFKIETLKKIFNLFEFIEDFQLLKKKLCDIERFEYNSGNFEWKDSSLLKSIQNGDWLLIENANILDSSVLDRLNCLLEKDGYLLVNEKGSVKDEDQVPIYPHSNFRIFLTMNPQYGELSRVIRNRGIEIFVSDSIPDFQELSSLIKKHGVLLEQKICQEILDHKSYHTFFKFFFQTISQPSNGFEFFQIEKHEKLACLFEKPIVLNMLVHDPTCFYSFQNYFTLKFSSTQVETIKLRLFSENLSLKSFETSLKIFEKFDLLHFEVYNKLFYPFMIQIRDDFKALFDQEIYYWLEKLPIDFRENTFLWNFIGKITHGSKTSINFFKLWNEKLNQIHLNFYWIEMKKILWDGKTQNSLIFVSNQSFPAFISDIILFLEYLIESYIFEKLSKLHSDHETIESRCHLVLMFQLLLLCNQPESDWENFLKDDFFPLWFLLNEKKVFHFQDSEKFLLRINQNFNINQYFFDQKKYDFIKKINPIFFKFETSQDNQVFYSYFEFFSLIQKHFCKALNEFVKNSSESLIKYFQRQIDHLIAFQQLSLWNELLKKQIVNLNQFNSIDNSDFSSNYYWWLDSLFSIKLLDFYSNNEKLQVLSSSKFFNYYIKNCFSSFFIDPLVVASTNEKHFDCLLNILLRLNQQFTITSFIKSYQSSSSQFNEFEKFSYLTFELMPVFSITCFDMFSIGRISLEKFFKNKSSMNFNLKFILKNYQILKSSSHLIFDQLIFLAQSLQPYFENFDHKFRLKIDHLLKTFSFKLYEPNNELNQIFYLVAIGHAVSAAVVPDFAIDPVMRNKVVLNDYLFQSNQFENELNLRGQLYNMYGFSQENFHSNIYRLMQDKCNEFKFKSSSEKLINLHRKNSSMYFQLKNEIDHFKNIIFQENLTIQIIEDFIDCLSNKNKSYEICFSKCFSYQKTLFEFINRLNDFYIDYRDILIPFLLGIYFVAKGFQLLAYRLQSIIYSKNIFRDNDINFVKKTLISFSKFVTTDSSFEVCQSIVEKNMIKLVISLANCFNLDEINLMTLLLKSTFLEIKNSISICNKKNLFDLFNLYLKLTNDFVEWWKKIEKNKELVQLKKEALFHFKLKDDDSIDEQQIQSFFPTFDHKFQDLAADVFPINVDCQTPAGNQDFLMLIARSHIDFVHMLEQPSSNFEMDFFKPYSLRYQILMEIFKKSFGFFDINLENDLIDGHLIINNYFLCSDQNSEKKSFDIYHDSNITEAEKCFNILQILSTEITQNLLIQFEEHPTLLKILKIIDRIGCLDLNSSLLYFATGLELILKTGEGWEAIAHQKISLKSIFNQITDLLVTWRLMEINYWSTSLETVVKKIEEKEISVWWLKFYIIVQDLILTNDQDETKSFIESVKQFIEESTLGQFHIRLKLIKTFIVHLKYCCLILEKKKMMEFLLISFINVYSFYNSFNFKITEIIDQEKLLIEKEIKNFVKISKWNPSNFWSLKASLKKSHEQLYGYVRKYQQALSKKSNNFFLFDKKHSNEVWRMPSTQIVFPDENHIELENFDFLFKNKISIIELSKKMNESSKLYVKSINHLECFNNQLIDTINNLSDLKLKKEIKDLKLWKNLVGQIQNKKRRTLSDFFKKLTHFGFSFQKGNVIEFDINEVFFTIKPFENTSLCDFEEFSQKNIIDCNVYYYKCTTKYLEFFNNVKLKPNSQLTFEMIDRLKGFAVNMTKTFIDFRFEISETWPHFLQLYEIYLNIKNFNHQTEKKENEKILDSKQVKKKFKSLRTFVLKLISFLNRLKALLSIKPIEIDNDRHIEFDFSSSAQIDFSNVNLSSFDELIASVTKVFNHIKKDFVFYNCSDLEKLKNYCFEIKNYIHFLSTIFFNNAPKFRDIIFKEQIDYFEVEIEAIFNLIDTTENFSEEQDTQKSCEQLCSHVVENILISIEKVHEYFCKNISHLDKKENNFVCKKIKQIFTCEIINLFEIEKILQLVMNFIKSINVVNDCDSTKLNLQIRVLFSFLEKYIVLFKFFLTLSFGSMKTCFKLLHITLHLFNELIVNGFCSPSEPTEQDSKTVDKNKNTGSSGFGSGDTTGAQDISNRLNCQDQLDELDKNDEENYDETLNNDPITNEKDGIEMDEDFEDNDNNENTNEENANAEENDSEQTETEDLDKKLGSVEDIEDVFDEKHWADENDSDEEMDSSNDPTDLTGGKEEIDSKTVANKENENLTSSSLDELADDANKDDPKLKSDENILNDDSSMDLDEYDNDENFQADKNMNNEEKNNDDEIDENINFEIDSEEEDKSEETKSFEDSEKIIEEKTDISSSDEEMRSSQKKEKIENNDENENTNLQYNSSFYDNSMKQQQSDNQENKQSNTSNTCDSNSTHLENYDQKMNGSLKSSFSNQIDQLNSLFDNQIHESFSQKIESFQLKNNNYNDRSQNLEASETKRKRVVDFKNDDSEIKSKEPKISNIFRHVNNKSQANDLAYDTTNDINESLELNSIDCDEDLVENNDEEAIDFSVNENKEIKVETSDNFHIQQKPNNLLNNENNIESDKTKLDKNLLCTSSVARNNESYFCTNEQKNNNELSNFNECNESLDFENLENSKRFISEVSWKQCQQKIEPLLYELCNQLQLVLEPTKRTKYKGDFKNGKRLNMRKVIAYIASEYRKNKIWMRRIKPSKRQYQIILAIDDSLSMSDNQSKLMAFESLLLLGKSLSVIESGMLSVLSFGENIKVVHKFGDPYTDETAFQMFSKLGFDQKKTKINELLKLSLKIFSKAHFFSGSSNLSVHQLLLILSDGRGIFSDNNSTCISSTLAELKQLNIFPVFIIIDNPDYKNSILDIRIPIFDNGKVKIKFYIDEFPFPYYVILKDLKSLPAVLGEALKQWFQLLSCQ